MQDGAAAKRSLSVWFFGISFAAILSTNESLLNSVFKNARSKPWQIRSVFMIMQSSRSFVINSGPVLVPWNLHSSHFLQEILHEWRSQRTLDSLAGFSSPTHHEPTRWIDGMLLSAMFCRSNGKPFPSLQRTITEVGKKKQIKLTLQKAYLPVYNGVRQGITACVMKCHKCRI